MRNQGYFTHLNSNEKRAQEIVQNFDKLMSYKRSAIKEHFKPLDIYFKEHNKKFTTNDLDLIDKAERNMEEIVHGYKRKRMERYDTSPDIERLIKFVEWATARGGDAFNEANYKKDTDLTEEEKEMKKPFWTRTYWVGTK